MIQLANDPNASRMSFKPAPSESKGRLDHPRSRGGHAWPFLSRQTGRAAQPASSRSTSSDSVS